MAMTPNTRRCWELAKKDIEFHEDMKQADPKNKVPGFFSDELDKIIFAGFYWGWLIGKGRYIGELKAYLSQK